MSEYEKHEADRKHREEKNKERKHSNTDDAGSDKDDGGSSQHDERGGRREVDYNALDYEDANQSEEEQETTTAKKVPSLVQYPINATSNGTQREKPEGELVPNKRSDALAMALGVQVKTGEDPPDGEIQISGYNKRQRPSPPQLEEVHETHVVSSKLAKPTVAEQEQNRGAERNKFNVEKPARANSPYQSYSGGRRMDNRRDRFYNRDRGPPGRFYRRPPPRFDDRRSRRSPPRRPNR